MPNTFPFFADTSVPSLPELTILPENETPSPAQTPHAAASAEGIPAAASLAAGNAGVILTHTLWDQSGAITLYQNGKYTELKGYTYNQFCPMEQGKYTLTGCMNTSTAQIMYYWLEKGQQLGVDYGLNFTIDSNKSTDYAYLKSSGKTYTLDDATRKQLNSYLASQNLTSGNFIAALVVYCAMKNHSTYGLSGNGGTATDFYIVDGDYEATYNLVEFAEAGFESHYSITYANKKFFTAKSGGYQLTDLALSILRENFDYGEPVRISIPGHSLYMDGYRLNSKNVYEYHVNYGWGTDSSDTGWYDLNGLTKINVKSIDIDIDPDISVLVTNTKAEYYGGSFLRGVERVNHILPVVENYAQTDFAFSSTLAGQSLTINSAQTFSDLVQLVFPDWNVHYTSSAGIALTFQNALQMTVSGSILACASNATAVKATDGKVILSLNNGVIYAGSGSAASIQQEAAKSTHASAQLASLAATANGTALLAGAQNDSITLKDNSVILGAISLGAGDDTVSLSQNSGIYGNLDFGKGKASLQLDSTSCFQGALLTSGTTGMLTLSLSLGSFNVQPLLTVTNDISTLLAGASITLAESAQLSLGSYALLDTTAAYTFYSSLAFQLFSASNQSIGTLSLNTILTFGDYSLGLAEEDSRLLLTIQEAGHPLVTIYKNGQEVESGRYFSGITLQTGGNDKIIVHSEGKVNGITVANGGTLQLEKDGTADSTRITAGGAMLLAGGSTASDVEVSAGGLLLTTGNAVLTDLQLADGASISLAEGTLLRGVMTVQGTLDIANAVDATGLQLTLKMNRSDITITHLANLQHLSSLTISLAASLIPGQYIFATGAAATPKITLLNSQGKNLGSLSSSFTADGQTIYSLRNDGGNLTLVVQQDELAPEIKNIHASETALTRQPVTVTADFSDNVFLQSSQYSLDGGKSWKNYTNGVNVTRNTTVLFRATDLAGHTTDASYEVNNIDSIAPEIHVTSTPNKWTTENITLSVAFSDDQQLNTQEYRLAGATGWTTYTQPLLFQENGTVSFRATDMAGNETIVNYEVKYIDREAPVIGTISANITEITKNNVILTIPVTDNGAIQSRQYRLGTSGNWSSFSGNTLTVKGNGTYYIRISDMAGNTSTTEYTVENIDKKPPTIVVTPDITEWTHQNVTLTATATDANGITKTEYRIGGGTWQIYTTPVTVTENCTVSFRATDMAGNEATASYNVRNIDRMPPVFISVSPSTTLLTNQPIILDVNVTDDSLSSLSAIENFLLQYRIDGGEWLEVPEELRIFQNGVVEFRAVDIAGNESFASCKVTNIDTVAPVISNIQQSTCDWTSKNVTLSADFSDDVSLAQKQYRIGGGEWLSYTSPVSVTANGIVTFRAIDEAGNETIQEHRVTNIDKTGPAITPRLSTNAATNQDVLLTADFSDGESYVTTKQFRLADQTEWQDYTDEGIWISENTTVYFQAADAVGNLTKQNIVITNIDKTPPVIEDIRQNTAAWTNKNVTVSATFRDNNLRMSREYSLGDSGVWTAYTASITLTENSVVHFRATDEAGNVTETQWEVTNIDKTSPVFQDVHASISSITNQPVTITAEVFEQNLQSIQYRLSSTTWADCTGTVTVTRNTTVFFRATDKAGNAATAEYVVANIDTTAPVISGITASTTAWTADNVELTANFSDNMFLAKTQYALDGGEWLDYTGAILLEQNATVSFRAVDAAGNETTTSHTISNIDKTPPVIGNIRQDVTEWTTKPVTVSADFSDDQALALRQYKLDDGAWQNYTRELVLRQNAVVTFRAQDKAGNEAVQSLCVTNIDTLPPEIYDITIEPETWTNREVIVSAQFRDDTGLVSTQYSLGDNGRWLDYAGPISINQNTTITFRAIDNVGNTVTESRAIQCIDTQAPGIVPGVPSETGWTNQDVLLKADFADDASGVCTRQYRLDDGIWLDYTDDGVLLSQNATVDFRALDEAGNETVSEKISIANIDKEAPVVTFETTPEGLRAISSLIKPHVSDNGELVSCEYQFAGGEWLSCPDTLEFSQNGLLNLRAMDAAGNETTAQLEINNISEPLVSDGALSPQEKTQTFILENLLDSGFYTAIGDFGTLNAKITIACGKKGIASGTIKKGVLSFNKGKQVLLDSTKEYTVTVSSTDKGKTQGNFLFTLAPSELFAHADSQKDAADDWTDCKTNGAASQELGDWEITEGPLKGWVGYGDAADYQKFQLEAATSLSLDIWSDDAVTVTLYSLNSKTNKQGETSYSLKKLQTITPKANKTTGEYGATTSNLLLQGGEYYLGITSKNAAKGGNANYKVSLNEDNTRSAPVVCNLDDTWKLAAANSSTTFTGGDSLQDWVGKGDAADYVALTYEEEGIRQFELDVTPDAVKKLKLTLVDAKGKSISLSTATDTEGHITAITRKSLLADTTYYLGIKNTASSKYNIDYSLSLA